MFANFHLTSALIGGCVGLLLALMIFNPWDENRRVREAAEPDDWQDEKRVERQTLGLDDYDTFPSLDSPLPIPPVKSALVMPKAALPFSYNLAQKPSLVPMAFAEGFWNIDTHMADRAYCETDESLQQLLPYVVVLSQVVGEVPQLLTYRRGASGTEGRLHGLLSIGFGGHVDAPPPRNEGLENWLKAEACRELQEEINLSCELERLVTVGLITDPTTPVGRVHCGVLMFIRVKPEEIGDSEHCIEGKQWMPMEMALALIDEMEPWSQVAMQNIGTAFEQIRRSEAA